MGKVGGGGGCYPKGDHGGPGGSCSGGGGGGGGRRPGTLTDTSNHPKYGPIVYLKGPPGHDEWVLYPPDFPKEKPPPPTPSPPLYLVSEGAHGARPAKGASGGAQGALRAPLAGLLGFPWATTSGAGLRGHRGAVRGPRWVSVAGSEVGNWWSVLRDIPVIHGI